MRNGKSAVAMEVLIGILGLALLGGIGAEAQSQDPELITIIVSGKGDTDCWGFGCDVAPIGSDLPDADMDGVPDFTPPESTDPLFTDRNLDKNGCVNKVTWTHKYKFPAGATVQNATLMFPVAGIEPSKFPSVLFLNNVPIAPNPLDMDQGPLGTGVAVVPLVPPLTDQIDFTSGRVNVRVQKGSTLTRKCDDIFFDSSLLVIQVLLPASQ